MIGNWPLPPWTPVLEIIVAIAAAWLGICVLDWWRRGR